MSNSNSETRPAIQIPRSDRQIGWKSWIVRCWLLAAAVLSPSTISAAGHEAVSRDQDVILQVDSRWPGNGYGGYFPLRIKLSNMGATRRLNIVFEGLDSRRKHALPKVQRTINVEQQATVNFTLSIPMVSTGTEGIVHVYGENGSELEGLVSRHALPDYGGAIPRTSLLVISTDAIDESLLQPFEDAATTEAAYLAGFTTTPGASHEIVERDHVMIQPGQNLPHNWIDYSGVDLVAVNWQDWNSQLTTIERDAILKWTATGGVLLIYGTGEPASQHQELHRSLHLERAAANHWTACQPESYAVTRVITAASIKTGVPTGVSPPTDTLRPDSSVWKIDADTFSRCDWMLGQVHVFPNNPFPGNASNWAWWLASVPQPLSRWPAKLGMSARTGNPEFLTFLIPGVGSVPVFVFLFLITAFTVIIGPLNYYWLHQRRRLALMVLTVPLIATITCLLLFSYSLMADGFSTRSRLHSFTWLDQQRKSAVSLSRMCLYAPFAPSAGLSFAPECAVFPIWPAAGGFEGGTVDWSANNQRFSSAWFRSQTWTQFLTVEQRDERGRFDFTPPSDPQAPTLAVSNGLSWDLDYVAVQVSDLRWYAGGPVTAGSTGVLRRTERGDVAQQFQLAADRTPWKYPEGTAEGQQYSSTLNFPAIPHFRPYHDLETTFARGLLSQYSAASASSATEPRHKYFDWRDGQSKTRTEPHAASSRPHFWAISRANPGVQTGIKSAIDSHSLHLLLGTF